MSRKKQKTELKCVWRLPDGRLWIRVKVKDPMTGQSRDKTTTLKPGATLADAIEAREALKAAIKGGLQNTRIPLVREYAESWVLQKATRTKPTTIQGWISHLEHHILPRFGELPLDEVRRPHLNAWAAHLEQQAKSGKVAIRSAKLYWSRSLQLLRDGWADYGLLDPSARAKPPKLSKPPKAGRALSVEQVAALFVEADRDSSAPYAGLLARTLAWTGLRVGEAAAIKWEDLDLDDDWVNVADSKTDTGIRTVPIPSVLSDAFRRRKAQSNLPGPLSSRVNWAREVFTRLSKRLGYKVTPHDLRRTYVTLLRRANVDALVARTVVGHANEEETARYFRPSKDDKRSLLRAIDKVVGVI